MADKLGTVTVVFKSGRDVKFKATSCTAKRGATGELTGIKMEGMERVDSWLYLRLDSIDAVLWEPNEEDLDLMIKHARLSKERTL